MKDLKPTMDLNANVISVITLHHFRFATIMYFSHKLILHLN